MESRQREKREGGNKEEGEGGLRDHEGRCNDEGVPTDCLIGPDQRLSSIPCETPTNDSAYLTSNGRLAIM